MNGGAVATDSSGEMPRVVIRELTWSELRTLRAANDSPEYVEHIRLPEHEKECSTSYLTAWLGTVPVGHLILKWEGDSQPEVREHVSDTPELNSISVWPAEMRSRGIGRKLIGSAEAMVKARGHNRVGLGVSR